MKTGWAMLVALIVTPLPLYAGEADVRDAAVSCSRKSCNFQVTVAHDDEGWKHYADRWEIIGLNEEILATRVLHHPHVNEQPFTRSLTGVVIPAGIKSVTLRAHDSVHGYGGREMTVELSR